MTTIRRTAFVAGLIAVVLTAGLLHQQPESDVSHAPAVEPDLAIATALEIPKGWPTPLLPHNRRNLEWMTRETDRRLPADAKPTLRIPA